jgi:molecular chaperone GrpE (heat shock protein)
MLSPPEALDLALRSQELDAVVSALLPLFDQIERICRGFDRLSPEDRLARAESVAILADIADRAVRESGLERFTDIGRLVDGARHEVVDTRPPDPEGQEKHGLIVASPEPGWLLHKEERVLRRAKVVAVSRQAG